MFHLTIAASNLKVAAPDQFEALIRAFQMLEDKAMADLLSAPSVGIVNAQGKADMVKQLKSRLVDCMEQRNKYQNRA